MAKDFDAARQARREKDRLTDRSFTVAGQTFNRRLQVVPEVLLPLDIIQPPKRGPKSVEHPEGEVIEAGSSLTEDFAAIDAVILACIDTDEDETAEARYRALRANTADIVTTSDLRELMEWLIEECAGRPTSRPSASQHTDGPTATTSTAGSPSPEPAAV